jgi:RND family efflux transporter MFP subunit
VSELKQDLDSLKIDRSERRASAWRWPLLLLIPALLGLGALYALRAQQALAAPGVEVVRAAVSRPGSDAGSPILTASGYVVARRKAVVSAKIQGRLAQLNVEEGSRVKEGEVIARLESRDFEAQVERSRAQIQRAEADLAEAERKQRLAEQLASERVVSRDSLEEARSRVRIAEAALAQARAELSLNQALYQNTVIRAPFGGTVVKKMAEVGESVAPIPPGVNISTASGAIVALADLDTLEVEADVNESNVARLQPDQPAEVSVEAFPDRSYRAVLRQIIPTADRTKATVMVKVTILDEDRDLKPEMSARVTFQAPVQKPSEGAAAAEPEVTVPREAVVSRDGRDVVFELREGRVSLKQVVLGPQRAERVVVRSGLAGGERLVARPPEGLNDGDAVRVEES